VTRLVAGKPGLRSFGAGRRPVKPSTELADTTSIPQNQGQIALLANAEVLEQSLIDVSL
jgi:hypothetical protein